MKEFNKELTRISNLPLSSRSQEFCCDSAIKKASDILDEYVKNSLEHDALAKEVFPDNYKTDDYVRVFDDDERNKKLIILAKKQKDINYISKERYAILCLHIIERVHDSRIRDGCYSKELGPISKKMENIKKNMV